MRTTVLPTTRMELRFPDVFEERDLQMVGANE